MKRFLGEEVIIKKDNTRGVLKSISEEDGLIVVETPTRNREFEASTIIDGKLIFADEELQSIAIPIFKEFVFRIEEVREAKDNEAVEKAKNNFVCRIRRDIGDSNVAFKCTYCDGGKSADSVGFKAPCSEEVRNFNIKTRTWCSGEVCRCKKLANGDISQAEFDSKINPTDRKEFLCYESRMLLDWICYAGVEQKTGIPMKLNKAQVGSLAVMTTRPIIDGKEAPQEKTQIFGVFLIAKHNDVSDIGGSVTAHPKYRIELTPEESKKMLLWKYHANERNEEKAMWGSGLFRYLSDMECCQILRDIVNVVKDENKKELANEFLEQFQQETGIINIEEPRGAFKEQNFSL